MSKDFLMVDIVSDEGELRALIRIDNIQEIYEFEDGTRINYFNKIDNESQQMVISYPSFETIGVILEGN